MGFFSGISKIAGGLSGMAGGAEQSQAVPASGFFSMPKEYQDLYKSYLSDVSGQFAGGKANDLFAPLAQTDYETTALDAIGQGFTPTQETLNADVAMQMNPFDNYVIDAINREAGGDYSILKQGLNEAGQFGSNRQILGANDIDLTRLNQIGGFKQNQYNTAVNNSLNQLTSGRRADAASQMTAGEFARGLDFDTKQAPINAISTFGGLLNNVPTSFGTQSEAGVAKSGSSAGSTLGKIGQAAQIAGTVASLFSDRRLKENIERVGEENGYPIYRFNYVNIPEKTYIGVMADEVEKVAPSAVREVEGMKQVDYDLIGVEFREAE